MVTKQQDAIDGANEEINYAQQLVNLYNQIQSFNRRFSQRAYQTAWDNQATYALNSDGSQGTADGSPNTAHPITNINMSASDLGTVSAMLTDFQYFMSNQAVGTADRISILANKLAQ